MGVGTHAGETETSRSPIISCVRDADAMVTARAGAFLVLEGLDATGKSTQLHRLGERLSGVLTTHQPSGATAVGQTVYELAENATIQSPLARQLLHLASHAEHYRTEIRPALLGGAVLMDRCWWSTVAYGWYGTDLGTIVDLETFLKVAQLPAEGLMPDMVFVFLDPWRADPHNMPSVRDGYESLLERYADRAVRVPPVDASATTTFILDVLEERGLVTPS